MKVVRGLFKTVRGITKDERKTDKVHIVAGCGFTKCGVNHAKSEILGIPEDGMIEEVNCKRCLKERLNC